MKKIKYFLVLFIFISCENDFLNQLQTDLKNIIKEEFIQPEVEVIKGRIIKVADGDSLTLLTEENEQIKIRLDGIDCPEKKQEFGNKAKEFTNSLCYNKDVIIIDKGLDRYGRTLGVVKTDSVIINEELLKHGLAWHYKSFNDSEKYAELEKEAKSKKLNIWSSKRPIAPWEFRKIKTN